MEVVRGLWIRYGSASQGYAPLNAASNGHVLNSFDRDHDAADSISVPLDRRPVISWRTEPKFEVSVNFRGLSRQIIPILWTLLPSFLLSSRHKKTRKMFPTSYLDGLRGVAAFFVVVHHYTTAYTESSFTGYGLVKDEPGSHNWFWLLPVVRVVHSGRFMVAIFFVISGYVLSYRSLKLARQGKQLEVYDSLTSSVFRRWLRLHLPVAASCFMGFMLARFNAFHHMPKGWEHDPSGKSHLQKQTLPFPRAKGSFFSQFADLFADVRYICDPFLYGAPTLSRYNPGVLWTIPVEFMGSMLVFLVVLGIARTRTWIKLTVISLLLYRAHQTARWSPATFLEGILLAEMSFMYARPIESPATILNADEEKDTRNNRSTRYKALAYKAFFLFIFVLGIYLGAQPKADWKTTPGYVWLYEHLPEGYAKNAANRAMFYPSIGAFLIVLSLDMAPYLQSIFTTSLAQYLGDISFSLYMIHFQIQSTLGEWLVPKMMDITGGWSNGQTGFIAGMVLSVAVLGPVTFWVADVFSRNVDEKCVKFARWVSTKAFLQL